MEAHVYTVNADIVADARLALCVDAVPSCMDVDMSLKVSTNEQGNEYSTCP